MDPDESTTTRFPLSFNYHKLEIGETQQEQAHIHILPMKDSFMVWVNSSNDMTMGNLSVSMMTRFNKNEPVCNNMFGDRSDLSSQRLSERLCKVTKKQVFVSYNMPSVQPDAARSIEHFLCAKLKE